MGREALHQADVVVHDRLGCEEILQDLPPSTRTIDVGKTPGGKKVPQERTNEILAEESQAGYRVVRLKGGDPLIFGRGMEEVLHLRSLGIRCHIVPGVSSVQAGPAAAGIPLTHRKLARGFAVSTGRGEHGMIPKVNDGDTRVYLMAMKSMSHIVEQLLAQGIPPATPAALISDASTYRQRTLRATLETVEEEAGRAGLEAPAVLVIGETAAFAVEEEKEKAIVVTTTRIPPILGERLPDKPALWRPLLRIEGLEGESRQKSRALVPEATEADWIIFNNRHSVREFFELLRESGHDARHLTGRLAAIGSEAAAELEQFCLVPDLVAVDGQRGGLAEFLAPYVEGRRVVFPCAEGYQGGLAPELVARSRASLLLFPAYRRTPRKAASIDWRHADAVFFASGAAVDRFAGEFPEAPLASLQAVVLGESPRRKAESAGFGAIRDLTANEPQASLEEPAVSATGSESTSESA